MGGGEGWVGVGREEAKAPQVKTRGPELPTDAPDHIVMVLYTTCTTALNFSY